MSALAVRVTFRAMSEPGGWARAGVVVGLLAACADEDPAGGQSATTGTTSAAEESTDASTTDTVRMDVLPVVDPPASGGIAVDFVEANQGVGVKIGLAGGAVAVEDRTAPLLADRVTLIRVFWTVPDDWVPREIRAEMTFFFPDGTTETQVESKLVEADSFAGNLDDTFNFGLMEAQTQPGLGYAVELFEVDPAFADPAVTVPPRLPLEGEQIQVGIEASWQLMKIVVVPFEYDDGAGCVTTPDTSEETMQLFWDSMYMMNPVDSLEIELHEPVQWTEPLSGFPQLNIFMSDLRFQEDAPPETYYYGLVDVCASGLGGAGGQAYGIPGAPSIDNAFQRVSSGLSLAPDWSAETFVHEVGHSQGRRHVACDGTEAGPDPSYPIEGGDVGEWGFGVIDYVLRHPTFNKDYMTYCHPVWVSTWGWNKVYPVIRTLSEWDPDHPANTAPDSDDTQRRDPWDGGSLLVGIAMADGHELWHTVPGRIDPAELGDDAIEFRIGDRLLARQGARVEPLPDGDERMIVTPLPIGFEAVDHIVRIHDETRIPIDRADVRIGHHLR